MMDTNRFATDVAKYFRDFLETNFHKRRTPKRSIKSRNEKNLLVGINLRTFDAVRNQIFKSLANSLEQNITVEKGRYTHGLSPSTWQIITRYCEAMEEDRLQEICLLLSDTANDIINSDDINLDIAKDTLSERIRSEVATAFFQPLIENISPALRNQSFDQEMIDSLANELKDLLSEKSSDLASDFVISSLVEKSTTNLKVNEIITLRSLKETIQTYFAGLTLEDLFFELNELNSNSKLIDKQQLYLHLFEIRYAGTSYPIFYIPIDLKPNTNSITIEFESILYVNKKAIDYIVENLSKTGDKRGKISSADDRIIHTSEKNIKDVVENIANDLLNFCELDGLFDVSSSRIQTFRSQHVSISNSCHISLFDKSDEALINDYEELLGILNSGGELGQNFCNLLESFLTQEPEKIIREIETEWHESSVEEKLVTVSPIPVNEEQNQIINALQKPACKYVVVQGPPGTGKSHTITAIVFRAILDRKNVLVLSDKTEALDVVEDKITEALNSVRLSDEFQNPILRLGKAGNTYSKILSNETLTKIKNHLAALRTEDRDLDRQTQLASQKLRNKISNEIAVYNKINLSEIKRLEQLESLSLLNPIEWIASEEFAQEGSVAVDDLESTMQIGLDLEDAFADPQTPVIKLYKNMWGNDLSYDKFNILKHCHTVANELHKYGIDGSNIGVISNLTLQNLRNLKSIVSRVEQIGTGLFGYLFKGRQLGDLLQEFRNQFSSSEITDLRSQKALLTKSIGDFERLEAEIKRHPILTESTQKPERIVLKILSSGVENFGRELNELMEDFNEIGEFISDYPLTSQKCDLNTAYDILRCRMPTTDLNAFETVCEALRLRSKLEEQFRNIPKYDFAHNKSSIEKLYCIQMTQLLDQRVVDFSENHSARAKTLKKIISGKKRFPKEEFEHLREAFPCIISGIRDYAEYIPLDSELFDLVIIDEASQVSIAQALPALLRAKQVVVFGDKRQFSNIKSAQARSEVNQQYLHTIKSSFTGPHNSSQMERLSTFNIKTSVLDFLEYICNYSTMLRKHFRGYRELISYSSKHFYNNHLQAIKIRAKSIDDTLQFHEVDHDGKLDLIENTNSLEIDAIIEYLEHLSNEAGHPSIGIITPHSNQQKAIFDRLRRHQLWETFQRKNKIRVMTFDTCQGEERDIIIYSMVATATCDKLGYIFIKSLDDIDFDEENKVKAQRLNVGFSRAKERMVFFISKPVSEFSGTIGDALRHYENTLLLAKSLPDASEVDPKSPMEAKVLQWIQETSFFKENSSSIELHAQFPIGEYLKQLDPYYRHPKYVCDFLFTYTNDLNTSYQILIEYDGFKEHFTNLQDVNELNFEYYYKSDDTFREKVLEGYGYKFLRINRFNIGSDPIDTLDKRLRALVKGNAGGTNPSFIREIHSIISGLEDGDLKECAKCGKLRALTEFHDESLVSGTGRYCRTCKRQPIARKRDRSQTRRPPETKEKAATSPCPRCGASMKRRTGPRGKFWGCSRFPACRGTRN